MAFFKLERGWQNSPCFVDNDDRMAWVWLIESACWEKTTIGVNGIPIELERGQCFYSIRYLAEAWRISPKRARIILDRFKKWHMISTENGEQKGKHGTLITICNYSKYQDEKQTEGERKGEYRANKKANGGQTVGTNKKEYKEVKERKNNIYTDEFEEFWKLYPKPDDKAGTFKKYKTALKETDHETIIDGVKRYIDAKPWGSDLQYCRQSTTWLAKRSWETSCSNNQPRGDSRAYTTGQSSYERGILASLQSAKDYEDEF